MLHFIKNLFRNESSSKVINKIELDEDSELWHAAFIEHFAFLMKPKVYVELGIHKCHLFNRMIPYAEKLVGVDIDTNAYKFMKKTSNASFVCSSTLEYAKQLEFNPLTIDMLFIDADHAVEAVLEDFYAFFPYVASHGIILIHDTHPKNKEFMDPSFCNDSFKVVDKLSENNKNIEFMTIPLHPGLTIIRKRKTQISWMETT